MIPPTLQENELLWFIPCGISSGEKIAGMKYKEGIRCCQVLTGK
jgi:hypothetical protein